MVNYERKQIVQISFEYQKKVTFYDLGQDICMIGPSTILEINVTVHEKRNRKIISFVV